MTYVELVGLLITLERSLEDHILVARVLSEDKEFIASSMSSEIQRLNYILRFYPVILKGIAKVRKELELNG